jgi:hypothetical protein
MSTMIDMVGAALLFGVLMLAVGRVQGNLNQTMAQNTFNLNTQSEAIYVARLIEYEVSKAGYGVTGSKISLADSQRIAFKGAMTYGGTIDSVAYYVGEPDTTTQNPDDFRFIRYAKSSGAISQRLVMTQFVITYYDSTNAKMAVPVTGTSLNAIRGINVKFRVESAEPVTDASTGLSNYNAVTWEKLIYPRNLGKPF